MARRRRSSNSKMIRSADMAEVLGLRPDDSVATEDEQYIAEAEKALLQMPQKARESIREAKEMAQAWTAGIAFIESTLFLITLGWTIAFIVFVSLNDYNTRLDYNTDFMGTSCVTIDDDDHNVCQEIEFGRDNAVDIHWIFFAMFVSLSCSYIMALGSVAAMKRGGFLIDNDSFSRSEQTNGGWWGIFGDGGILGTITWPVRYLAMQSYSHASINYNIRHLTFDALMFPIAFGMFGVRDYWKFGFISVLAVAWNVWIHLAQLDNRRSWIAVKLQSMLPDVIVHRQVAYWFAAIMQAMFGAFLWVLLLVYFVKFPYHSRQWYQYFVAIVLLTTTGIRVLFNLLRWVAQDCRTGGSLPKEAGAVAMTLYWLAQVGVGLSKVLCSYPFVIQMVLSIMDGLTLFLPWILLAGLNGHSNIAQIVFPSDVVFTY